MFKIVATVLLSALLLSSCNHNGPATTTKEESPSSTQDNPPNPDPHEPSPSNTTEPNPSDPTHTNPPEPNPSDPTHTNPPDPNLNTPPSAIKDKTTFPPLAAKLPPLNTTSGWQKVQSTKSADIPNIMPTPAKVFFKAQKKINGRDRTISVVFGDLRKEPDAIVNAANTGLEGGGGIDGLIHNAAKVNGQDLLKDEAIAYKKHHKITSLPTGSAMVMNPYGLAPGLKMIVFTAGPSLGASQTTSTPEQDLELYSAVYNSLLKASEYGAKSLSMPTISSGIFRFPLPRASELYFGAALQFFADHPESSIEHVRIVDIAQNKIQALGAQFTNLWP